MLRTLVSAGLLFASLASATVVDDVRARIAVKDFAGGDRLVAAYQKSRGATPELALAISWLGRGSLAAKNFDQADAYAAQAKRMSLALVGKGKLDSDPILPTALGAAIEVHGQTLHARRETAAALEYLGEEARLYAKTSIVERIRKNINLISLEGKPAPALEAR